MEIRVESEDLASLVQPALQVSLVHVWHVPERVREGVGSKEVDFVPPNRRGWGPGMAVATPLLAAVTDRERFIALDAAASALVASVAAPLHLRLAGLASAGTWSFTRCADMCIGSDGEVWPEANSITARWVEVYHNKALTGSGPPRWFAERGRRRGRETRFGARQRSETLLRVEGRSKPGAAINR